MSAADHVSREQLGRILDYHGGTIFPHPDGGYEITLSQLLSEKTKLPGHTRVEYLDRSHPVISAFMDKEKDVPENFKGY
jgi:hypothetical protein